MAEAGNMPSRAPSPIKAPDAPPGGYNILFILTDQERLFRPGERVRLRIINAAAQTTFNLRIPGLPMMVVATDGVDLRPVETDEFQIGNAETYDVIVMPTEDRAFTLVAEAVDRSGMARATLAPRLGMTADVPPLRERPLGTMKDMGMGGMDHSGMDMPDTRNPAAIRGIDPSAEQNESRNLWKLTGWSGDEAAAASAVKAAAAHSGHAAGASGGSAMDHGSMDMRDFRNAPQVEPGPGVQSISPMPADRTGEAPVGLEGLPHRVLVYRDLVALEGNPDARAPSRSLEIHLTGNMERFMWSIDGKTFADAAPIHFDYGERLRLTEAVHPRRLGAQRFRCDLSSTIDLARRRPPSDRRRRGLRRRGHRRVASSKYWTRSVRACAATHRAGRCSSGSARRRCRSRRTG